MKFSILTFLALALSLKALAQGPSLSESAFCADRKNSEFVKDLALTSNNLMSFLNKGGIGGQGVCWWHSRFQRNALYLTIFRPDLAEADEAEALSIIKKLRAGNEVVSIPGFKNFAEFSLKYKNQIQQELEKWQKSDGTLGFAWVKGLSGSSKVASRKMKELMDQIYEEVEVKKNIAYNKLQIPGLDAHAWSVLHMTKVENGYDLEVLDSNAGNYIELYKFREGDETIIYHPDHAVVPARILKAQLDQLNEQWNVKYNYSYKIVLAGYLYNPWSVMGIKKTKEGYDLRVYVTNQKLKTATEYTYKYKNGDNEIDYGFFGERVKYPTWNFTPYLEQTDEMQKIQKTILKVCDPDSYEVMVKKEKDEAEKKRTQNLG